MQFLPFPHQLDQSFLPVLQVNGSLLQYFLQVFRFQPASPLHIANILFKLTLLVVQQFLEVLLVFPDLALKLLCFFVDFVVETADLHFEFFNFCRLILNDSGVLRKQLLLSPYF